MTKNYYHSKSQSLLLKVHEHAFVFLGTPNANSRHANTLKPPEPPSTPNSLSLPISPFYQEPSPNCGSFIENYVYCS